MDKKQIYLIGFMGTGKTTVSGYLKERYGLDILEMDREIEVRAGRTIPQIFADEGEESFRRMETQLLADLGERGEMVVSCGGGAVMRDENVRLMKKNGYLILLDATAEEIYERVRHSHHRPLLEGNMNVPYIDQLLQKRLPRYREAADRTVRVGGRTVAEIGDEIYIWWNTRMKDTDIV